MVHVLSQIRRQGVSPSWRSQFDDQVDRLAKLLKYWERVTFHDYWHGVEELYRCAKLDGGALAAKTPFFMIGSEVIPLPNLLANWRNSTCGEVEVSEELVPELERGSPPGESWWLLAQGLSTSPGDQGAAVELSGREILNLFLLAPQHLFSAGRGFLLDLDPRRAEVIVLIFDERLVRVKKVDRDDPQADCYQRLCARKRLFCHS